MNIAPLPLRPFSRDPRKLAIVYLLRPNNTAIWITPELATQLRVKRGDQLTEAQMAHALPR